MQITSIQAENFLSYEHFEINLANRGLVLIEGENRDSGGSNGAGKSAIFEALTWCLFNVVNRPVKGDDVVRLDAQKKPLKNCRVVVEIDVDGRMVRIIRHRRHHQFSNKMLLFVDGKELTMGGDRETQDKLETLLQIDSASFINAVMFPQGAAGFASLTDAEQKAILDRVLGTERFAEAQKRVKTKYDKLEKSQLTLRTLRFAKQQQIQQLRANEIELNNRELHFQKQKQENIDSAKAQRAALEASPPPCDSTLDARMADLHQQVAAHKLQEQYQQLQIKQAAYQAADRRAASDSAKLELLRKQVADAGPEPLAPPFDLDVRVKAEQDLRSALAARRQNFQLRDRELKAAVAKQKQRDSVTNCHTCGTVLSDEVKDRMFGMLVADIQTLTNDIHLLTQEIANDEAVLRSTSAEVSALQQKAEVWKGWKARTESASAIPELEASVSAFWSETARLQADFAAASDSYRRSYESVAGLNAQLEVLVRQKQSEQQAVSAWQTQINAVVQQLRASEASQSPYAELIVKARNDLAAATAQIGVSELVERTLTNDLSYLEFWIEGFGNGGVKSLLLDTVAPYLSFRASKYLEALTNGTGSVEVRTQKELKSGEKREKFEVVASYAFGGNQYGGVSGGERRRVDIACLLALGDLAASRSFAPIKLRLLDEIFESLDSVGAEQVIDMLKREVVPNCKTVLLMSHDDHLKAIVENRITVVKENGVSRVLEN